MDIKGLWDGSLSWRRLKVILDLLPEHSATWTAIRDNVTPEQLAEQREAVGRKKHGRWSKTDLLLASIADRIAIGNYYFLSANSDGKKKVKPPEPIERPGVDTKNVTAINPAARAYLEKLRDNHGAVVA